MKPVGLIAGAGRFPLAFAEKMNQLGRPVVALGIRGMADDAALTAVAREYHAVGIANVTRFFRLFRKAGVEEIVLAGKVFKASLLRSWLILYHLPDWRTFKFWYFHRRRDNKDDSLLLGVIAEFEREGFRFTSALDYCPELLVRAGTLTRRAASAAELRDIEFGWTLAKDMGRLDVGQSVAVRNRAVLAVEAIEGTDAMIRRAGELCRRAGFVVVKVAKPNQDRRFDVPTIGPATLEAMRQAGARVLAVEAGATIILDEAETVAAANRLGVTLVALDTAALSEAA